MFSKNIKYLRKKKGWTQNDLAKRLGYSAFTTVNKWETGVNKAPYTKLQKIAQLFNVTEDDLMNTDLEQRDLDMRSGKVEPDTEYVRIKVLGSIHAGIPIEAITDIVDWEDIPKDWTTGGREYFGLRVKGDCMEPEYREGDVVIVRRQEDCESGQDCIVYVNGYDAELKRVTKTKDAVILQALNPKYPPKHYYNGDEEYPVKIAGVVVELRRKI